MSQVIEKGYEVGYSIKVIRSIKVTPAGDFNGQKYASSVKIKTVNIVQEDDEKYGLVEREQIMEFKIPTDDTKLRTFNQFLRDMQKSNTPLDLIGSMPNQAGKDTYTVTSYEDASEIMARYTDKKK